MGKLTVSCFLSLDGVIGSAWEWAGPYYTEDQKAYAIKGLNRTDLFLVGRKSYEIFSARWPNIQGDAYFDRMNTIPKLVASTTLKEATWNAHVIRTDIADQVAKLKDAGQHILKYGLGELDQLLLRRQLIDEFQFTILPLAVRSGPHAFEGIDLDGIELKLQDSRVFSNGVITLIYRPLYRHPTEPVTL